MLQENVSAIPEESQQIIPIRTPFSLPQSNGEEKHVYVAAVKQDAPFEYISISSISFSKYVMPSEATYVKNEGKQFFPRIPCSKMTEKQAKAIFERSKEILVTIPGKATDDGYEKSYIVKASDWIILCKASEYNVLASPRIEETPISQSDPLDIKSRDRAFVEERKKK